MRHTLTHGPGPVEFHIKPVLHVVQLKIVLLHARQDLSHRRQLLSAPVVCPAGHGSTHLVLSKARYNVPLHEVHDVVPAAKHVLHPVAQF